MSPEAETSRWISDSTRSIQYAPTLLNETLELKNILLKSIL